MTPEEAIRLGRRSGGRSPLDLMSTQEKLREKLVKILGYPKATTTNLVRIDALNDLITTEVTAAVKETLEILDDSFDESTVEYEHQVGFEKAYGDFMLGKMRIQDRLTTTTNQEP